MRRAADVSNLEAKSGKTATYTSHPIPLPSTIFSLSLLNPFLLNLKKKISSRATAVPCPTPSTQIPSCNPAGKGAAGTTPHPSAAATAPTTRVQLIPRVFLSAPGRHNKMCIDFVIAQTKTVPFSQPCSILSNLHGYKQGGTISSLGLRHESSALIFPLEPG